MDYFPRGKIYREVITETALQRFCAINLHHEYDALFNRVIDIQTHPKLAEYE